MDDEEALEWNHKTVDLRRQHRFERQADAAECRRLSELFGNETQCRALAADYTIVPRTPDNYRVFGEIRALIVQVCGVTLDPIEQAIDEPFDVEFRRGTRPVADMEPDFDALGDDDPEPIEHGLIKVGRLACEIVASAIDPFPRAEDATLDQHEVGAEEADAHPFAALARLKGDEKPN